MQDATIRIGLDRISSILNYAGTDGLLAFLSVETFKYFEDRYASFELMKKHYSLIKNENDWTKAMDKLVEMKLANNMQKYYITVKKLNNWKEWATTHTPKSLEFNGFIIFNMHEFYKKVHKKVDLKDLIYLTIRENVVKEKTYSRGFVKDLTGLSAEEQKKIEERHPDLVEVVGNQYVPISKETKVDSNKPIFPGEFVPSKFKCKRNSPRFSNCKIIQSGNKVKIKNLNLSYFQVGKRFNNSCKREKVKNPIVIDSSKTFQQSNGNYIHQNDYKLPKLFINIIPENVIVLDEKGYVKSLKNSINL